MQEQRNMADLQAFLDDGLRSEELLRLRLQSLKEANTQQLLEAEKRQREALEKRIQQNSKLSADTDGISSAERQLEAFFNSQTRWAGPRTTRSDLTSNKGSITGTSQHIKHTERCVTASTANVSTTSVPRQDHRSPKAIHVGPQCGRPHAETTKPSREEEEEAECQRKFTAAPVPSHVFLPLYQEVVEGREQVRKQGLEQRRNFLVSMQKPFSFMEVDERKREKLVDTFSGVTQDQKAKAVSIRKPIPKAVMDPAISERLKAEELNRKVRIQARAQETLRKSLCPLQTQIASNTTQLRSSQRTKREILAFLDEKPSFRPRTNSQVPDFDRLHKAFQKEALRSAERREVTRCQPFHLRTSTLPTRPSKASQENTQEPIVSVRLKRSHSFGGVTSLSTDTLPTYITDAARQRCLAIRKSMEQIDSQKQESAEWMRRHEMRSQALKKTVSMRAKVMDPHSSLKDVYHEKLKQHKEADQQRAREYKKELRNMKARITVRPYLFEQVTQRNAKADVERRYRDKLKEAGVNEHFVATMGREEVTSLKSDKEEDADDQSVASDTQSREAGVSDGEKIKEEEEESVKTNEEKSI
ncbi:protein FAM161B [Osmerus eperlanus]|uniref:protein FAM161B n=1 Tax=Osmerus eperlanus TaxID=29151 RepID=UPI002E0E4958